MKKTNIKSLKDNELICSYVSQYSFLRKAIELGINVEGLKNLVKEIECELIERKILTKKDVEALNS